MIRILLTGVVAALPLAAAAQPAPKPACEAAEHRQFEKFHLD